MNSSMAGWAPKSFQISRLAILGLRDIHGTQRTDLLSGGCTIREV